MGTIPDTALALSGQYAFGFFSISSPRYQGILMTNDETSQLPTPNSQRDAFGRDAYGRDTFGENDEKKSIFRKAEKTRQEKDPSNFSFDPGRHFE